MENEQQKLTAAYLPFQTFLNALDQIAANNVPNVIDRTMFRGFSGGALTQIISGFKFLRLIDENGKPQEILHSLALQKENRKTILEGILRQRYASLIALDLARTTPSEFDKELSTPTYNVHGETRGKAKAFFIRAAQFVEIPISKLLLQRASPNRKKRTSNGNGKQESLYKDEPIEKEQFEETKLPPVNETSKTIALRGGGVLTLSASINLLTLKGKDRDFVFKLIDLLDEYETDTQNLEAEKAAAQVEQQTETTKDSNESRDY